MSDGSARCSGLNESGQLGNGNNGTSLTPVIVENTNGSGALKGISQIATGNFYACARMANGTVDCWGDNTYGQLGNGTKTGSSLPVVVKNPTGTGPLTGVVQVATGKYNTCARISNGTVDCWGNNGYYQLGDGTNHEHLLPHAVQNGAGHGPLTGQIFISVGQYDTCSVQSDGSARCWGLNQFGVLGDTTQIFRPRPSRVRAVTGSGFLSGVTSIAAAPNHTCALLKNGTMDCWGNNAFGQLGDGTTTTRLRPVLVKNVLGTAALLHIVQITTAGGSSGDHTCARLAAGTALCWGSNFFGQLGDNTKTARHRPVIVRSTSGGGTLSHITSIVAGPIDTCATTTTGARCWGFNQGGQFGNGTAKNSSKPVAAKP